MIPELVHSLFKQIQFQRDETPNESTRYYDQEACDELRKNALPALKSFFLSKLFEDDEEFNRVLYLVQLVKKGWMFGSISNAEYSKFIDMIKRPHFISLFPYVMGCFRLSQMMEVPQIGFSDVRDLMKLALTQCSECFDLLVPSRLLTLSQTYYRVNENGSKECLLDFMKNQRIFMKKEFWECYLLWSALSSMKDEDINQNRGVDVNIRNNLDEKVGSVFLSIVFEMANTGVDKNTAKQVIMGYADRFHLSEKNRTLVTGFFEEYKV